MVVSRRDMLFQEIAEREGFAAPEPRSNYLVLRIQPDEGISLSFAAKRPGMQLVLQPVRMEFGYAHSFPQILPEAYERLWKMRDGAKRMPARPSINVTSCRSAMRGGGVPSA